MGLHASKNPQPPSHIREGPQSVLESNMGEAMEEFFRIAEEINRSLVDEGACVDDRFVTTTTRWFAQAPQPMHTCKSSQTTAQGACLCAGLGGSAPRVSQGATRWTTRSCGSSTSQSLKRYRIRGSPRWSEHFRHLFRLRDVRRSVVCVVCASKNPYIAKLYTTAWCGVCTMTSAYSAAAVWGLS